jgi:RNA polymerase sigma-70 factor, ECF subfamily
MPYADSLHFTAVYANGRAIELILVPHDRCRASTERYCDPAGAKAVAQIVALDGLETSAGPGNRDRAHGRAGQARSTAIGEGLQHENETLIPRLRRYARVLTRDVDAAEDLVLDSLTSVLRKIHVWEPGTDLRAWPFTILHNHHINNLRRAVRYRAPIEARRPYRTLALMPDQNAKLEVRDVERALAKLPADQRLLILFIGMEGMRYEDTAAVFNLRSARCDRQLLAAAPTCVY